MSRNRKILISICITAAALCAAVLVLFFTGRRRDTQQNELLAEEVFSEAETAGTSSAPETEESRTAEETEPETVPETEKPYVSPVDFAALHEINQEIYAWLKLGNTDIDFPVAQHEDPEYRDYYLVTGFDHTPNQTGTLYSIPGECGKDSEHVIIIYGHNQSKFSELKNYRDTSYWDERRYIDLYLEEQEIRYDIFAFAEVSDDLLTDVFDFRTEKGIREFLEDLWEHETSTSHIFGGCSEEDRIIILSTCVPGNGGRRFLVIGRAESDR